LGFAQKLKLLLDTHILIWVASAPGKIGKAATRRLEDSRTELWFSPLSLLEIFNLNTKGRIGHGDPRWWFPELKRELGLIEAPVTSEIAFETSHFTLPTGDPVDRLLVATARILKLTFLTADEPIIQSRSVAVLPNR
jgi:PIN domain nuclease of toxin-antitoxin system